MMFVDAGDGIDDANFECAKADKLVIALAAELKWKEAMLTGHLAKTCCCDRPCNNCTNTYGASSLMPYTSTCNTCCHMISSVQLYGIKLGVSH